MTKKFFAIFVSLIIVLGSCISNATSMDEKIKPNIEKIESLIEINNGTEWEELEINKCTAKGMNIYAQGIYKETEEAISLIHSYNDDKIVRVLKNGYGSINLKEIRELKYDDAYVATKIALDCITNKDEAFVRENYYRVGTNLSGDKLKRAEDIIKAVDKLLEIANDTKLSCSITVDFEPIGKLKVDELDENYYSQEFEVKINNVRLNNYHVSVTTKSDIKLEIVNPVNNEAVEDGKFDSDEKRFKIRILREDKDENIDLEICSIISYDANRVFIGANSSNRYVIYTQTTIDYYGTQYLSIAGMTAPEKKEENTEESGKEENKEEENEKEEIEENGKEENTEESGKEENKEEENKKEETEENGKEENTDETNKGDIQKPDIKEEPTDVEQGSGESQKDVITKDPNNEEPKDENLPNNEQPKDEEKDESKQPEESKDEITILPTEQNKEEIKVNEEKVEEDDKGKQDAYEDKYEKSEEEKIDIKEETNIDTDEKNKYIASDNYIEKNYEEKLPRTGNDYFLVKIILVNLIIFLIFEVLILKKYKKKTDC